MESLQQPISSLNEFLPIPSKACGHLVMRAPEIASSRLVEDSPGHVSGAGQDLVVVQEAAARQVARVAGQLPGNSDVAFAGLQAKRQTQHEEH